MKKYPRIPNFKYHPDPIATGVFKELERKRKVCPCCGKSTRIYYSGPLNAKKTSKYICPACIHNGKAAQFVKGTFGSPCVPNDVNWPERLEELRFRTPGYYTWQTMDWLTHCDDFCAFVGDVTWADIEEMGITEEIEQDITVNMPYEDIDHLKDFLDGDFISGYLFRCLHCGKYRLHTDRD